jgi:hypothetical protein
VTSEIILLYTRVFQISLIFPGNIWPVKFLAFFKKTIDYIFKIGLGILFPNAVFLSCLLLPNYILLLWRCIYF